MGIVECELMGTSTILIDQHANKGTCWASIMRTIYRMLHEAKYTLKSSHVTYLILLAFAKRERRKRTSLVQKVLFYLLCAIQQSMDYLDCPLFSFIALI